MAKEACESLLHTRDGQLCDVMIDRAALEAIHQAGEKSSDEILKNYAESTVAVADIKDPDAFHEDRKITGIYKEGAGPCRTLDVSRLAVTAMSGMEAICQYLQGAGYSAEAAEAIQESSSAFERWCDNQIIHTIQPEKYHPFSIGPLVAATRWPGKMRLRQFGLF